MSTKNEIKPVALSEVDKQMEFYKQAVIERDRLRETLADSMRAIGEAGVILEQMREFWKYGTPIYAGSDLANDFIAWGERIVPTQPARAALKEGK